MNGRLIDISRTISTGALVYPGDPPLEMRRRFRIGPESPFNLTELVWTSHFLTHIDAPRHFFEDGAALDEIAPERFGGEALVVQADGPAVGPEHVPENVQGLNLLFKTSNSARWDPHQYLRDHAYISGEAAQRMAAGGANLAGIDYLSVDRYGDESYPAHRRLLGRGVLILEGIDLAGVAPGRYRLFAFPLKIADGDGSPVRALLEPL